MNGSKLISMTLDEMKAARERGESETNWALLRQNRQAGREPETDEDAPDATALMHQAVQLKRAGRPAGSSKEQIALRVDRDVLETFRARGAGWQTLMNRALREWLMEHPHQEG